MKGEWGGEAGLDDEPLEDGDDDDDVNVEFAGPLLLLDE